MPPQRRSRRSRASRRGVGGTRAQVRRGAGRLGTARARRAGLLRRPAGDFDALVVGYPATSICRRPAARRRDGRSSSTRSSRWPTRSSPIAGGSAPARFPHAFSQKSTAQHFARPTSSSRTRPRRRSSSAGSALGGSRCASSARRSASSAPAGKCWSRSHALFVGKLIPLHGIETILEAAPLAPGSVPRRSAADSSSTCWRNDRRTSNGCRGSSTRASRAAPRLRLRARDLRNVGQGAARDPQQGVQALACGAPVITADTPAIRAARRGRPAARAAG